eukprot:1326652-Amorphochlora_amoeboformis.AAC.2
MARSSSKRPREEDKEVETKKKIKSGPEDGEGGPDRDEKVPTGGRMTKEEKKAITAARGGGVYIPPHKLKRMQSQISDKKSKAFQRIHWDALRKSINGLINKVNTSNIKMIIPELFNENVVRGRGLLVRACMKAQMASPNFTHVYAALIAIVNTKMPEIGELCLKRVVMQVMSSDSRDMKKINSSEGGSSKGRGEVED